MTEMGQQLQCFYKVALFIYFDAKSFVFFMYIYLIFLFISYTEINHLNFVFLQFHLPEYIYIMHTYM